MSRTASCSPSWRATFPAPARKVYVAPCYKLTYDEDGYCVKMTTCAIPEDIAAKLAELNK
ncbi:MAG: hypothetical protein ACLSHJ_06880 [Oscillospiraceae bacterium]